MSARDEAQAHGAQKPRHIKRIVEVASTAQCVGTVREPPSFAQAINQCFPWKGMEMSIRVVAKHVVKEDGKEEFVAILQELVQKTRLEKGCISYSLYESLDDPNIVTMLEEWESKEALDTHIKTEHFTRIIPQTGKFLSVPVAIDSYQKQLV